jgi:hypothetical protein
MFIHFTSETDADAIVRSGVLWADKYHGQVYACEVGKTAFCEEVAISKNRGRLTSGHDRTHAVVFGARLPDERSRFEEEVIWELPELPLDDAFVVPAAEAIELLQTAYVRPRKVRDTWGDWYPFYGDAVAVR